jgi:hypothetical protein
MEAKEVKLLASFSQMHDPGLGGLEFEHKLK